MRWESLEVQSVLVDWTGWSNGLGLGKLCRAVNLIGENLGMTFGYEVIWHGSPLLYDQ